MGGVDFVTPNTGTVSGGGTGVVSLTANAPLFGGTTATGAIQSGTVGAAGQVLTSNGTGTVPTFQNPGTSRVKTSDVTNNTTTFANITGLSATLVAGHFYSGRVAIKCINSTATEGIKFDFNGGDATMTSFWAGAGILSSGGTDIIGTNISTSLAGVINFTTFTGESVVVFDVSFKVNAAGTFIPRFAENSTAVGTATVRIDSYMNIQDTA